MTEYDCVTQAVPQSLNSFFRVTTELLDKGTVFRASPKMSNTYNFPDLDPCILHYVNDY